MYSDVIIKHYEIFQLQNSQIHNCVLTTLGMCGQFGESKIVDCNVTEFLPELHISHKQNTSLQLSAYAGI